MKKKITHTHFPLCPAIGYRVWDGATTTTTSAASASTAAHHSSWNIVFIFIIIKLWWWWILQPDNASTGFVLSRLVCVNVMCAHALARALSLTINNEWKKKKETENKKHNTNYKRLVVESFNGMKSISKFHLIKCSIIEKQSKKSSYRIRNFCIGFGNLSSFQWHHSHDDIRRFKQCQRNDTMESFGQMWTSHWFVRKVSTN